MKKYPYLIIYYICFLILASCTQDEFEPDPIGEKVPFEEIKKNTLEDALQKSGNDLFLTALKNSNIPSLLSDWGKEPLTLLVPSDNAFKSAGYTKDKIALMSAQDLDTLLLYHILQGQLDTTVVKKTAGSVQLSSKLNTTVTFRESPTLYTYGHNVVISNNNLIIDGKNRSAYHVEKTKGPDLIFINNLLIRPTEDIWKTLKRYPDLSIFMELLQLQDYAYNNIPTWWGGISSWPEATAINYLSIVSNTNQNTIPYQSIFAPTNEAFIKAGYSTAEDFLKLNDLNKRDKIGTFMYYRYGAVYDFQPFLKSDSIISYHSLWGRRYFPTDTRPNPIVFFSNDLKDEILSNYIINTRYDSDSKPPIKCPFKFSKTSDGQVQIKLKDAKEGTEAATVVESDIMTLNGPIHIVDRLFIPKGF